jgi:DNA replication and repair protein RecF
LYLQSLELHNFRNIAERRFEFSPEVNVIYGPNASGKTNVLEAIYLLSNLRSFRTYRLRDLIQWEQANAYIRGTVKTDFYKSASPNGAANPDIRPNASGKTLAIKLEAASRTAFLQGKPCRSSRDYLQVLPSTAFIPDDLELVKGLPANRRFFLDRGTFQFYPPYWSVLTDYKKTLQQKNAVLRQFKERQRKKTTSFSVESETLGRSAPWEIWNEQLRQIGSQVILQRLRFVSGLRRILPNIYSRWLGNSETLDLIYQASIRLPVEELMPLLEPSKTSPTQVLEHITQVYEKAIERNLDRELRLGSTVIGPHRDDIDVMLMDRELRAFGSQGQQRTAVLALKIAEVLLYFEQHQEYPLLILDDVTSELDEKRTERLFEYVQHGMQVFISTTSKPDIPIDRSLACEYFNITEL